MLGGGDVKVVRVGFVDCVCVFACVFACVFMCDYVCVYEGIG